MSASDWNWCRAVVPVYNHPFTGAGFCGADAPYIDEVSEQGYCAEHAGPLAWSDCKVNAYTIAVRVSGHLDVPVDSRWHEAGGERAA